MELNHLITKAKKIRTEVLKLSLDKNEAHLGGSFSIVEILLSLYDCILTEKDEFILSKGHASFPYFLMLKEKGKNPFISTHPEIDLINGIPCTTGSLGHGLPIGLGMAMARKLKGKGGNVYVLMGDGECQEGTTWESMLIGAHHKLNNLVVIIDHNKIQALGRIDEILSLNNLADKFKAFNWQVIEVNGHSFPEIILALKTKSLEKPTAVIAHTIKGKGVSCFENDPRWHTRLPDEEELKKALEELK